MLLQMSLVSIIAVACKFL